MDTVALIEFIAGLFDQYGILITFLSGLFEMTPLGAPFPGGSIVIIAGFFSYDTNNALVKIILSGWFGSWLSFLLSYLFGYKTGNFLISKFKQQKNAERARHLLDKHGAVILTTSMLASALRFWVAYIAGIKKYNLKKFLFYSGAASLTWTSLMAITGYLAGTQKGNLESAIAKAGILGWIFVAIALFAIGKSINKEINQLK